MVHTTVFFAVSKYVGSVPPLTTINRFRLNPLVEMLSVNITLNTSKLMVTWPGEAGETATVTRVDDACKGLKGDAKKDILAHVENANWTNVRVHAASIEPVGVKNETTKLKGFAVKGVGFIPTKAADVDSLRSFCSKNNIPKQRKGSKKTLADAIAAKCVLYLEAVAQGKEEEFMTDNSNTNSDVNVHFIMKRFLNVLMSTAFRPRLLQQLGRRLNKDDLEEGLKMNEEVFKFFLCEYNKTGKYGVSHFVVDGFDQDAAAFTPILESSWKKALDKFKEISLIYNEAFNASKQSGFHDNFGDTAAVEREPWLNYLHLMIEERGANSDELRRAIFSELPADVFSDSTRGRPNKPDSSASSGTSQRRDRGRDRGGGETKKQKVAASEAKALDSMAKKNAEQARLARVQTRSHLDSQIEVQEKKRSESKKELLRVYDNDFHTVKRKVDEYSKFREQSDDGVDSDSDDELEQFSQPHILKQHYDAKKSVQCLKKERKEMEKKNL